MNFEREIMAMLEEQTKTKQSKTYILTHELDLYKSCFSEDEIKKTKLRALLESD